MPGLTKRLHVQVQLDSVCTVWCYGPSCHLGQRHVGLRRRLRAVRANHENGERPLNTYDRMLCTRCLPTARCVSSTLADPATGHVICSHRAMLNCHYVANACPCLEGDCMLR